MATEEMIDEKAEFVSVKRIVIQRGVIIYGKSVANLSEIVSVWVAEHGHVVLSRTPLWLYWMALLGGFCALISWFSNFEMGLLLAATILFFALWGLHRFPSQAMATKNALAIKRKNGCATFFQSVDERFAGDAAFALMLAITQGTSRGEKVVIDFDRRQVTFESAVGSVSSIGSMIGRPDFEL